MTGDVRLYLKTIIIFSVFAGTYGIILFLPMPVWVMMCLYALMGGLFALIGFNMMHDGSHGSYSGNKTINTIMAHTLNLMGGNAMLWHQKHNLNHHTYTNVEGYDDDIDLKPFVRVHEDQKWQWFHRFQFFYMFILYGLTLFFWVYYRDFKKYIVRKIAENTPMKKMNLGDHINFWVSKVAHVSIFLVIPSMVIGWQLTLIGYIIMGYVCGIFLAVVFQLAHIVEGPDFVTPETDQKKIENDWAVHQIHTTADFGTRNPMLNWFLGGLNFQVVHHLFPRISHVHYREIQPIIKQTCEEFNVPYHEFPSMMSALISHIKHMKKMGEKPESTSNKFVVESVSL